MVYYDFDKMFEISHVHVWNANCTTCCLSPLGNVLCLCKFGFTLHLPQQSLTQSEFLGWQISFWNAKNRPRQTSKPAPTLVTSLCWVRPFSDHMKPNKCAKREMFALCEYHIDIVFSLCHFSPLHLMFSNFSGSTIRVSWCTIFLFFLGWKTNYICTWN